MKHKLFTAFLAVLIIVAWASVMTIIAAFISKGKQTAESTKEAGQKTASTCYRKEMNDFLSVQSDIIVINNNPFVCTKTKDGVFCQVIPECP